MDFQKKVLWMRWMMTQSPTERADCIDLGACSTLGSVVWYGLRRRTLASSYSQLP